MSALRTSLLLLAAAPLAACLQPPPANPDHDAAVHDAAPPTPDAIPHDALVPDATPPPCASGECAQLLAIGLWRHDPDDLSSVALLRRDPAAGTWQRLANAQDSNDSNAFDVAWGDCCGPSGGPDDLPDLLAAHFYTLKVSQLRHLGGGLSATPFVAPPQPDGPGGGAQAVWFDVDGDGDLDILTGLPNLRWHRNTTPGFDSPLSLDAAVARISLASWDTETAPELLVVDRRDPVGDPAGRGTVVLDRGATAWDTFVPVLPANTENALFCDIYDGPLPDLVVTSYSDMDIYPNHEAAVNGNWLDLVAWHDFPSTEQLNQATLCGDLNGDGLADLLISTGDGLRAVFHGSLVTTLLWDPASVGTEATFISDMVLADPDHNGFNDILLTLGDDVGDAEAIAEPVAYLLPNQTATVGASELDLGTPEVLLSSRVDGLSLAYVEFATPPR